MTGKKLKIGILVDSMSVAAWAHEMLSRIHNSDFADISLIIVNKNIPPKPRALGDKIKTRRWGIFNAALRRILYKVFNSQFDKLRGQPDAFQSCPLQPLLDGVDCLAVEPKRRKVSDYVSPADIEKIAAYQLDVLIRLGFRILRGDILTVAKCGVWSFHHGDNQVNRGGPNGFWEVVDGQPTTGSILQILTEDLDNGLVLYRSYSCTHFSSVTLNRNRNFWKTLLFMPRKLKELHTLGHKAFMDKVSRENDFPAFYSNRLFVRPNNRELASILWRGFKHKLQRKLIYSRNFEQWFLLFRLGNDISPNLRTYRKIVPPKDRFWADPHVITRDGLHYVFIEEYMYHSRRGHISVLTLDGKGNVSTPKQVLEKPYHLSYPNVFEYDGETYMIPESGENRTIELYRCKRFPDQWEWEMNLMEDLEAYDATLLFHQGKWWLFANLVEQPGSSSWDELFIFYSDTLLSQDWKPHAANPVISDVRRARPAGKIFERHGKIYRPSQNCSNQYGFGFNFACITKLSETAYEEQLVAEVVPNWDKRIKATHTFNYSNGLSICDGKMLRRK